MRIITPSANRLVGGLLAMILVLAVAPLSLAADVLTIEVDAGEYQIINRDQSQLIKMEGFGYLKVPGKPMLPAKNFLIALPPGARARSVEVRGIGAEQLPGTYQIMPTPPILPLADAPQYQELVEELQLECQENNQTVYSSDQAYPKERGKLKTLGTLRKYSYVSVSFYPFSYHPQSGRLVHYHAAQITIKYNLPSPGTAEAQRVDESKRDNLADQRASELFVNYDEMKGLYQPTGSPREAESQTHDYVIITSNTLQSAIVASNFLDWKASLGYDIRTVFITDPEIAGQAGVDLAEKIRNFLRYNYIPWGIEYVLLVGGCETIPMRYCYPGGSDVPTDYYYADLSYSDADSWDSDGDGVYGEYSQDSPDFLAEVYVGRIPTSDSTRITYTLNKLVAFEQDTGSWKDQALHANAISRFANQDYDSVTFVEGHCLYSIEADLMNGWTISHYSEQEGLSTSGYPWPALSESAFINDWRNGQYGVVNWYGHGSWSHVVRMVWVWDDGDGVPETDGSDLIEQPAFISVWSNLDDDHPSIVFAISCNVGWPEPQAGGNLGIDLLTEPEFGSSAGIVSATRSGCATADWFGRPAGIDAICYEFNRYMITELRRIGDAIYDSKFYCNQNYAWDHYYEYRNMFGLNLYGDPSLVREGVSGFTCGDCNGDGIVDVGDVVFLVNYLYKNGSAPDPVQAGDCNCDSTVDLGDVVYLINYLFKQGSPPGGC